MQEGRQSEVKNSWLGQPREICSWQMFALEVFHYQLCIRTAAHSALLQTEFEGERGSSKGWPLKEELLQTIPWNASWFPLCSDSMAQHCPRATIPLPAFLQQVMRKQPWSLILLVHHHMWTNTVSTFISTPRLINSNVFKLETVMRPQSLLFLSCSTIGLKILYDFPKRHRLLTSVYQEQENIGTSLGFVQG